MKKSILIFSFLSLLIIAQGQEMESLIFGVQDMHLNMRPDSTEGSTQINLSRYGDFRHAQVNFHYWYEDYAFDPEPMGGYAKWEVGVNGGTSNEGDFSIENFRLGFDIAYLRSDFIIRQDNGFVGINKSIFEKPEARLHIDHISTGKGEDVPALLVGSSRYSNSYMTIHKPKFDQNDGIAQFAENGYSTVYINGPNADCQLNVFGEVCAYSYYTKPIIVILLGKQKSAGTLLDKLKIASNLKSINSNEEGVGIDIKSLRSLAPSLVAQTEAMQDDGTTRTEEVVNYTGLIPILVAGHQEQTKELETAQSEIQLLKEQINKLEALIESKL